MNLLNVFSMYVLSSLPKHSDDNRFFGKGYVKLMASLMIGTLRLCSVFFHSLSIWLSFVVMVSLMY
jgi:hypothetical protein